MEYLGGFIIMLFILCFFMLLIWLIMPFIAYRINRRQERVITALDGIEKRLAAVEERLSSLESHSQTESDQHP